MTVLNAAAMLIIWLQGRVCERASRHCCGNYTGNTYNTGYGVGWLGTSQCSTLVRNTVVRATIIVNGKPPILGSRSTLTPWPIDLIFDMGDKVGDMTPHAKKCKNLPRPGRGWNVKIKCGLFLYGLLPASGNHIFTRINTVFAPDSVFRWGLIS